MREEEFILKFKDNWMELESYIQTLQRSGLKTFSVTELESFLYQYNLVCSNLSYARTHFPSAKIVCYLNALVTKSHNHIYSTESSRMKDLKAFFMRDFPALLKENIALFLASFFILLLGVLMSMLLTLQDISNATVFVGDIQIRSGNTGSSGGLMSNSPIASSFILSNNIRVGFIAVCTGFTAGIGTVLILLYNGFMLGALLAMVIQTGSTLDFFSLILPHGILELTAIFVCGCAGLMIAKSIIHPGRYSRKDAVILSGKKAIQLVFGSIPMFIIAGIIEGYFTPAAISPVLKLIFAGSTFLLLLAYLLGTSFWDENSNQQIESYISR